MGKNLKGKECGKGICQRKDGLYYARYTSKSGQKYQKYFKTVQEAKNWLAREQDIPSTKPESSITVNEWFEYWHGNIVNDLSVNTRRNYRERYERNMKPIIGDMLISDVRPMHCKAVLNSMTDNYAGSTIRQAYIAMGTMFRSAVMNDIIAKHPMNGVRFAKPVRAPSDIRFLTLNEQRAFMAAAKRSHNYRQYALILETGLRTGELIGLTWDCVNLDSGTLTVNKTLEYRHSVGVWRAGPPKSKNSYRTIPLTQKAIDILRSLDSERPFRKESPSLNQTLEFVDRKTGEKNSLCLRDLVFINWRTGEPAKNSSYDTHLYKLCDEANIDKFCMHALRHTYATRAIESGIQPKVLQRLLGHASIKTTMDRYVHVTEESMANAIKAFESYNVCKSV